MTDRVEKDKKWEQVQIKVRCLPDRAVLVVVVGACSARARLVGACSGARCWLVGGWVGGRSGGGRGSRCSQRTMLSSSLCCLCGAVLAFGWRLRACASLGQRSAPISKRVAPSDRNVRGVWCVTRLCFTHCLCRRSFDRSLQAFTSWFNSVLAKRDLKIENIEADLCDGVALLSFLEISNNKKMLQSWNKRPQMRVHKIENQSIALNYITNDMKVRLVGIGAEGMYPHPSPLLPSYPPPNLLVPSVLDQLFSSSVCRSIARGLILTHGGSVRFG